MDWNALLAFVITSIPVVFGVITPIVIRHITIVQQNKLQNNINNDIKATVQELKDKLEESEARFKDIQDRLKRMDKR